MTITESRGEEFVFLRCAISHLPSAIPKLRFTAALAAREPSIEH
jgi:hypothetical protein